MQSGNKRHSFTLSVAPTTRGIGYCAIENPGSLVDWGLKAVTGDKNVESLKKVRELIEYFCPTRLVLQDVSKPDCRRADRIVRLSEAIILLAKKCAVKVTLVSNSQIRKHFFGNKRGTKYKIACLLAERFPEELQVRLPRKRKPWMSEDSRMDIFDAISIAIAYQALQ